MRENLLIDSVRYILNEHYENRKFSIKIAKDNMRQQTLRTSLGIGWVIVRDLVYFTVFILFRLLMSGSGTIEGMNFILYLMLGMIPWNFMNECINGGVLAIKSRKNIISSIKLPIVILPTIEIMAIFMKRLFTLVVLFFVVAVFGDLKDVNLIMFIYYFFCMFIFMVIWNLIFSSMVAISNDFEQLYKALSSVLIYAMPIMWSFERLGDHVFLIRLLMLNPFVYVIEGFRDACVIGRLPDVEYSLYFWGLSLILLCVGSILQYKLRRHYVDLI